MTGASESGAAVPERIDVLGSPVDCVDMEQALEIVDSMIDGGGAWSGAGPGSVIAVNPEKIMRARTDPALRRFLWSARLIIPDGIGVVYAARLLAQRHIARVPGVELMPAICAQAARRGYTVYLFGADETVNWRAAEALCARYPGLRIVGRHHGFVDGAAMPQLIADINACAPDVLFVALGSPRQEFWLERHLRELRVKVAQGVGGSFDVIAGKVRRAPAIFRRYHLEWFYRLAADPRRVLRQRALPRFAYHVVRQKLTGDGKLPG